MSVPQTPERRVYSLSEITGSIERMFEKFYENPYWIKAEISALNYYPVTGHCFPLLVEKSEDKIKAQIKATIWRDDLSYITQKFEQDTKEKFREGLNIMFLAHVRFSSLYGLSLQIIDIEPLYTLGEMALDKMNTIAALKEQGIYNNNRLLPVPLIIKRLAVISVETSKGYNDLMVTLRNNKMGYYIITRLFPAVLQGKGAVESIVGQLKLIRALYLQYDAVAIVRGGGDDVGLSCYDQFALAREVALFPIPVITGIGHSTNETVTEMVACLNKITPTDVAHYILSGFIEQDTALREKANDFTNAVREVLSAEKEKAGSILEVITGLMGGFIAEKSEELKDIAIGFTSCANALLFNNRVAFSKYEISIAFLPGQTIAKAKELTGNHVKKLLFNAQHSLNSQKQLLQEKDNLLRNLDPRNVLRRGYAIVKVAGKVPDRNDEIHEGDQIEIDTAWHSINGRVEQVKKLRTE
ncbi:MAG TPA: exodeoxyribonuclease VII large subunit [Lentimicrobium sp.]|nr:exodeoxyribonuclease VII large subunit [Lentimicrobium sp.]